MEGDFNCENEIVKNKDLQGRIQDSPKEGPPSTREAPILYYFKKIYKFSFKIWSNEGCATGSATDLLETTYQRTA